MEVRTIQRAKKHILPGNLVTTIAHLWQAMIQTTQYTRKPITTDTRFRMFVFMVANAAREHKYIHRKIFTTPLEWNPWADFISIDQLAVHLKLSKHKQYTNAQTEFKVALQTLVLPWFQVWQTGEFYEPPEIDSDFDPDSSCGEYESNAEFIGDENIDLF